VLLNNLAEIIRWTWWLATASCLGAVGAFMFLLLWERARRRRWKRSLRKGFSAIRAFEPGKKHDPQKSNMCQSGFRIDHDGR
jgi:hypothetical protein